MDEGDALTFYNDVVGGDNHASMERKEFVLQASNNRELEIYLTKVDRKFVIDQLNKLPEEMLEMFAQVDDPDDIDEEEATDALGGLSGQAIEAFEELCAESMDHGELTEHHFEDMVTELDLEVLFEMGGRIIQMSLEDSGKITGFRERS